MALATIISILALFSFLVIQARKRARKAFPLPPGPPSDPLIGHLRVMPSEKQEDVFHEWAKTYGKHFGSIPQFRYVLRSPFGVGDVISLNILGRSIIILDSVQAAVDLLEKRSRNYSDRPRFVVFEL